MTDCDLSDLNLPQCIIDKYNEVGLTTMFQWQVECLQLPGVLDGKNIVYSAPTSAGKSLVAEILLVKRLLKTRKKAIVILPFVSLAREKMFAMKHIFEVSGLRVDGYMSGMAPSGGFSSIDVAVCTIEKANSLINRLIDDQQIHQLGMLAVDEIHMVGDDHRGYLIELLLTKIRYMGEAQKSSSTQQNNINVQIVGMSATIPNLDLLSTWLGAELYQTDFRPVPLLNTVKIGTEIYDEEFNKIRDCVPVKNLPGDDDGVSACCIETLSTGHSVLIFCPTKSWCEKLAQSIANHFHLLNSQSSHMHIALNTNKLHETIEQLQRSPAGLDDVLKKTVQHGVAYHHAGLTCEERDIIEGGFRNSVVRVLVATSTLSSGESILICKPSEKNKAKKLVAGHLAPVRSCLMSLSDSNPEISAAMKRAILEIIVNGIACVYEDVQSYIKCSLLFCQLNTEQSSSQSKRRRSSPASTHADERVIKGCITWLEEHEFIYLQKKEQEDDITSSVISATKLGRAALMSSLPTSEALRVLADLQSASQAFALDTELHLVYQITPIFSFNGAVNWFNYLSLFEGLPPAHRRVGALVGVEDRFLTMAATGSVKLSGRLSESRQRQVNIHTRFYASLILHDLIQEVPLSTICRKFDGNRGVIQSLQQSAATFAGMVTAFCQQLGWWSLEVLLKEFQNRLIFGVQRELLDLAQISLLTNERARALYNAGLTSCESVAKTDPKDVELILRNSNKFSSKRIQKKDGESETIGSFQNLNGIRFSGGKVTITVGEAALAIVKEAQAIANVKDPLKQSKTDDSILSRGNQTSLQHLPLGKNHPDFHSLSRMSPLESKKDAVEDVKSVKTNVIEEGHLITENNRFSAKNRSDCEKVEGIDSEDVSLCCNQDAERNRNLNAKEDVINPCSSITESQMAAVLEDEFSMISSQKGSASNKIPFRSGPSEQHSLSTTVEGHTSNNRLSFGNPAMVPNKISSSTPISRPAEHASGSFSFNRASLESASSPSLKRSYDATQALSIVENESLMNELFSSRNNFSDDLFGAASHNSQKKASMSGASANTSVVNWSSESAFNCHINDKACDDKSRSPPFSKYGKHGNFSFESNFSSSSLKNMRLSTSSCRSSDPDHSLPFSVFGKSSENQDVYKMVKINPTFDAVRKFIKEWSRQKEFSFSFCLKHQLAKDNEMLVHDTNLSLHGVAVYWGKTTVYYICLKDTTPLKECNVTSSKKRSQEEACEKLIRDFFKDVDSSFIVTSFHMKSQIKFLFKYFAIHLNDNSWQDSGLAAWMLDPSEEGCSSDIMESVKTHSPELFSSLKDFHTRMSRDHLRSNSANGVQSCVEAIASLHLMKHLEEKLREMKMWRHFCRFEMPHMISLAVLELNGVAIDMELLNKERTRLEKLCEKLQLAAWDSVGRKFNLSSCKELSKILFCELGLKKEHSPKKFKNNGLISSRKIKTNWSTKKEVLEDLAEQPNPHPLVKIIMDWRSANYLLKKIVLPISTSSKMSHALSWRYHPMTSYTVTGRVSFNLQSITKPTTISMPEAGDEVDHPQELQFSLRNVITTSEKSSVLLTADYSQIELRLIAHLSGDDVLLGFLNNDGDVFRSMAAKMYGKNCNPEKVTSEERSHMKAIFYALLYGMGTKRLSKRLHMNEEATETFVNDLMRNYPKLQIYLRQIVESCKERGYIVTVCGRRRYLPDITSKNKATRSQAERQAINSTVQGSASDLIKAATCHIEQEVKARQWDAVRCVTKSDDKEPSSVCYLVHQIHDELMYEVSDHLVSEFAVIVRDCMVNALPLTVRLKVNLKTGQSWGNLKEYLSC